MSASRADFRCLIEQYQRDVIGRQYLHWENLAFVDEISAMKTIFLEGACFDFAAALHQLAGWPVYEIQWGARMPDDPNECDTSPGSNWGIHRVVQHPSGRYIDASGWTDLEKVLARLDRADATYQWMGEVDPDTGTFEVDFDLVKQVAIALLPKET